MATLFISDVHLDAGRPLAGELFLRFLKERAVRADALYILGDLFEVWLGDDAVFSAHEPLLAALRTLAASSVPVYIQYGNRDFLMNGGFEERTGSRLLPDEFVVDLYGTPALLMHGDSLCTDDVDYQRFRAHVRDPQVQRQFLDLSVEKRIEVARGYRDMSTQRNSMKAQDIMDVNAAAVMAALQRHGVRRLIHGHTHRPAIHYIKTTGAERMVLGDWHEQAVIGVCDAAGCRLETYT